MERCTCSVSQLSACHEMQSRQHAASNESLTAAEWRYRGCACNTTICSGGAAPSTVCSCGGTIASDAKRCMGTMKRKRTSR